MEEGGKQRRAGAEPGAGPAPRAASPGPLCAPSHVGLLQAQGTVLNPETAYGARPGSGRMGSERHSPTGCPELSLSWHAGTTHVAELPPVKGEERVCRDPSTNPAHAPGADFR